ncbi:metallophosphoesterase [Chitinophaga solisilvae]|uniref:metallophosphoesterase n=1 Tax=Chitinophaga solisilvae TaxID=1233460 RepID=UPI00136B61B0|nr:metallophosphoesterase [Chitinophaga solisilvae]
MKPLYLLSVLVALCTATSLTTNAQTTLLPFGATWKYLDNGSNQGTSWRAASFNDGSWASGPGQLGYGDGDESTVVSYGSSSSSKYVTTYFRKTFNITGIANYTGFSLEYLRDDGIVVYINGTEVKRDNLSSGTISYTTLATDAADDGTAIQTTSIGTGVLTEGSNTIAVEIHQSSKSSSDISFDLQLKGITSSTVPSISRGPYLQMGNQTAVTVRWRTGIAATGKVKYGTVLGNLTDSVVHTNALTEHELRITGLQPDTKYYYSVGTTTGVIEASDKNYFNTAPPANTTRKIRIAAYGDCGTNEANQRSARDAYINYVGAGHTDLWLLLGDNAYDGGFDAEYQTNFFNNYKDNLLKNILLFPAPGNHDYDNDGARQDDHNIPYLANFTLPANGECGGVASGKEEYYSVDYGDIHIISLDSYGREGGKRFYDTTSPQIQWLKRDLAANTKKWTIAYWHHPPYTMGSHNSDTESELVKVRQQLIRILERYGVDVILNGHSHNYERSYLIKGHYGLENTFSFSSHAVSNSSAKYDGTSNSCPYVLPSAKSYHGTVYVVAGSAGQIGGTQSSYPHAVSYYSNSDKSGSLVLEIEGNRLDAKFVASDKTIKDRFTILKDANKKTTVQATAGQPLELTASWIGNYQWNNGAVTRSITVTPSAGTSTYYVSDNSVAGSQCVRDSFVVVTTALARLGQTDSIPASSKKVAFTFRVYPNPAPANIIQVETDSQREQPMQFTITDFSGKQVHNKLLRVPSGVSKQTYTLSPGIYLVTFSNATEKVTQKIVVQ